MASVWVQAYDFGLMGGWNVYLASQLKKKNEKRTLGVFFCPADKPWQDSQDCTICKRDVLMRCI